MRWGWVLVAAAVAAAAAAALVPMESVAQRVPAQASPLSTNADRFDLSGPGSRGGLEDAASLTVGVAPGTDDNPPTGGATGTPPPDWLALPVPLANRLQLVRRIRRRARSAASAIVVSQVVAGTLPSPVRAW